MIQLKRNPRNKKKNRVYLWKKNPGMRDDGLWRSCVRERQHEVWKKSREREAKESSRLRKLRLKREITWIIMWIYFIESVGNFVNLERVNWRIHLVNNLSTLLSLQIFPILGNYKLRVRGSWNPINYGRHHKFICFDIKILITHQIQLFLQINNHLSQKSKLKIIYIQRRRNHMYMLTLKFFLSIFLKKKFEALITLM